MSLTGKFPKDSYKSILQIDGDNQELDGTLRSVTDGSGNSTGLSLSTTKSSTPLVGTNYHILSANGTSTANGTELTDAYAAAKAAVHSPVLSTTNRYVIVCPPGQYDIGSGTLRLDTDYIDIKSSTGERDVIIISSASDDNSADSGAAISIETDDCVVVGVVALSKRFQIYNGGASNYKLINCQGDNKSFGFKAACAGYHERCECAGDFGFGSVAGGVASGVFVDCVSEGSFGFGGSGGIASGTFIRCVSNSDYGISSFYQETASGYFAYCENRHTIVTANQGDFGSGNNSTCSGDFWYCTTEQGQSFGGDVGSVFSGNAWYCSAGQSSFGSRLNAVGVGGGDFQGNAYYCYAGIESFGGNEATKSSFSGNAYYCIAGGDSFSNGGSINFTGSIKLCLHNDAELNA